MKAPVDQQQQCAILALHQDDNEVFSSHITLDNLVSKLACLLGVYTFLHQGDIRCINVTKYSIDSDGILSLALIATKEKVEVSSTEVDVRGSPLEDLLICPVNAYSSYLARFLTNLGHIHHHKTSKTTPRPDTVPLLRFLHDPTRVITTATIGTKITQFDDHMSFPVERPRYRAIGSTLVAFHNVSVDDVKRHGRWSRLAGTFERFYRPNRKSAISFSLIALSGSGTIASVSGLLGDGADSACRHSDPIALQSTLLDSPELQTLFYIAIDYHTLDLSRHDRPQGCDTLLQSLKVGIILSFGFYRHHCRKSIHSQISGKIMVIRDGEFGKSDGLYLQFAKDSTIRESTIDDPTIHEPTIHRPTIHKPTIHELSIHKPTIHELSIHKPIIHELSINKPTIHELSIHMYSILRRVRRVNDITVIFLQMEKISLVTSF
ncbi:hypothetical protein BGW39_011519 [Mortierella sp. 14UC]|nr:hypothetical protein BGW39_011519 [Mortierella sp. 14UC]